MTARGPIEVHIEELALTGFDADVGELVGQAVRDQLTRLLAAGEHTLTCGGDRDVIYAAAPGTAAGTSAEQTGHGVARAIYGELGG